MTIQGVKKESDKKKTALSYWSKDKCLCPVCNKEFDREIMLSGQGRMIAGKLTDELHRIFEPSKRYGRIYPLIYDIGACPNCFTAMLWSDFKDIKNKDAAEKMYSDSEKRRKAPCFLLKMPKSLSFSPEHPRRGSAVPWSARRLLAEMGLDSYLRVFLRKPDVNL